MEELKAEWIWDRSSAHEKNYWLSFRKEFAVQTLVHAQLRITADSRYTLYINGVFIGRGPMRFWPHAMCYDTYDVTKYLVQDVNVISVDVNHYGVSTSQYIHAPGALFLQCDIQQMEGDFSVVSDDSFTCKRNAAYSNTTSRVNIAQPWVEYYDANLFDESSRKAFYDDRMWESATVLQLSVDEKYTKLMPCDIPPLASVPVFAKCVLQKNTIAAMGKAVVVDFKPSFYPGDTSTTDRLQLGYLGTVIHSERDQKGLFKLISKKWPFTKEKLRVNGQVYHLEEMQNTVELTLCKGDNFFLLDISGGYQRFSAELFFGFQDIDFTIPGEHAHSFFTVGPFDSVEIGNVVCADGFSVNWEDARYKQVMEACCWDELQKSDTMLHLVNPIDVDLDSVKAVAKEKNILKRHNVLPEDCGMLIPGACSTVILPGENAMEYLIAFEREVSGFLEIELSAQAGVRLEMLGFEYLDHGTPEIPDDLNNSMIYRTKEGRNKFLFHRRIGMRYLLLTVRGNTKPVEIFQICLHESFYPAVQTGDFSCSDALLTRIWEMSRDTLQLCMEDAYVDCPAFEQAYWIGDARNVMLMQSYVFWAPDLAKRSLRLAAYSLTRSAIPECHVPAGVSFVLTAWALLWVIACKECWDLYADEAFSKEIFPSVEQTLDAFCKQLNAEHLLEIDAWNMLDWAEMDTPFHGVVTHQNGLFVKALTEAAVLARLIGEDALAVRYEAVAQMVKEAINRHLWDEERKAFVDCLRKDEGQSKVVSLQTNLILKLADCVDEERLQWINPYFTSCPSDVVAIGSPFMSFFQYQMLGEEKKSQEILDDIRKGWGTMLQYGTTTCWETFIGYYKERLTRSYCHAWSCAPCYALGRYTLGVESKAPGFRRALIQPQVADLLWARGAVPTPQGAISVEWQIKEGWFTLDISLPEGVEAEVVVPETYAARASVYINGTLSARQHSPETL